MTDISRCFRLSRTTTTTTTFRKGTIPGYTAEESEDIYAEAFRVMCTPSVVGTSYEAASTIDPIFWVIHPTIER